MGTLLESARALNADGVELPQNNVMILLTDAEEPGLLGAEAFVRERGDELGTTVVLNHEARGVGGTPAFRMSSPNSGLLEVLSRTPRALADSRLRHSHRGWRRLLSQPARQPHASQHGFPAAHG